MVSNGAGMLSQADDELGRQTQNQYDSRGLTTATTEAAGRHQPSPRRPSRVARPDRRRLLVRHRRPPTRPRHCTTTQYDAPPIPVGAATLSHAVRARTNPLSDQVVPQGPASWGGELAGPRRSGRSPRGSSPRGQLAPVQGRSLSPNASGGPRAVSPVASVRLGWGEEPLPVFAPRGPVSWPRHSSWHRLASIFKSFAAKSVVATCRGHDTPDSPSPHRPPASASGRPY
jgi:hypothetical protein